MAKATKKRTKKRDRRAGIGLSTQPWRKADVAYLNTEAAKLGIELTFSVETNTLGARVRTVHLKSSSMDDAQDFIVKHFAFPSPYRARVITKVDATTAVSAEEPKEPTSFEEQCSFCGKRKRDVKGMVSGPCVYICNECVTLCNGVLGEDAPPDVDPKTLATIVRFARQVPPEVSDDLAVKVIDDMVDARLTELRLWNVARGRGRIEPSDVLAAAVSGLGMAFVSQYLYGRGAQMSPTSVEGTASSTEREE